MKGFTVLWRCPILPQTSLLSFFAQSLWFWIVVLFTFLQVPHRVCHCLFGNKFHVHFEEVGALA